MIVKGIYIAPQRISSAEKALPAQFHRDDVFAALGAAHAPWRTLEEATRRLIRTNVAKDAYRSLGKHRYERVG